MLFKEAIPCNTNSFSIHAIPTCNGQKMVADQYPYDRNVTDIQKKDSAFSGRNNSKKPKFEYEYNKESL